MFAPTPVAAKWQLLGKDGILRLPFRQTRRHIAAFTLLQVFHLFYLKGACVYSPCWILTCRPSRGVKLGWYFLFCFDGQLHCFRFFKVNCAANRLVSMHGLVTEAWHTTVHFDSRQNGGMLRCCCSVCLFVRLISEAHGNLPFVYEMSRTSARLIDWLTEQAGGLGTITGPVHK